jgi:hypothetical protein
MYECPGCRRRWTDANAEANGYRCYRACDTSLIHMEDDPGHHLDHLAGVVLGGDSGIHDLREAIRAVQPGGVVECPAGRHDEPLVLDKRLTLRKAPGERRELVVEAAVAPALKVREAAGEPAARYLGDVVLEGLTVNRTAPPDRMPLLVVESGSLVLRGCRLDCRGGPGIMVKPGARLSLEDTVIHAATLYGVEVAEGASLEMVGGRLQGVAEGSEWRTEATGGAGDATGIIISGSASVSLLKPAIAGFRRAINVSDSGGSLKGVSVRGCGEGVVLKGCHGLDITDCRFEDLDGPAVRARGGDGRMAGCRFLGGKVQVIVEETELDAEDLVFDGATETACRAGRGARVRIRDSRFEDGAGNGIVADHADVVGNDLKATAQAGVAVIALEGAEVLLRSLHADRCGAAVCAMPGSHLTLEGGVLSHASGSLALVQEGAAAAFRETRFEGAAADLVVVARTPEPVSFDRCRFRQGAAAAVRLADGAMVDLRGGDIAGNGGDGVIAGIGTRLALHETVITENRGFGLLAGPRAGIVCESSRIEENGRSGIRGVGCADLRVSRSRLAGNGGAAAHLEDIVSTAWDDCSLESNREQGVFLCVTAGVVEGSEANFRSCTVASNGAEGLLAFGPCEATLEECRLAGNEAAPFRVFGGGRLAVSGGTIARDPGQAARVGREGSAQIQGASFTGRRLSLKIGPRAKVSLQGNSWPSRRWLSVLRTLR